MADNKEQFVAEVSFETDKLQTGVKQANRVFETFETKSTAIFEKFSKVAVDNIDRVNRDLDSQAAHFQKYANDQTASLAKVQQELKKQGDVDLRGQFDAIASRGSAIVGSFLGAAGQIEQFRLTLTTLTGSTAEADKQLAKLQSYANLTPFNLENVVGAGVQLRTLGVDVDRFLPLAGDLASVFNRDIKDSAQALGKALSGSQDGIQVLNDSFGISKRELREAGASMGDAGSIALNTSGDLAKLADAIEKVAQKKNFVGAVNQQLGTLQANISQAQDAAFNLAAAIGGALAPAFIPLAQAVTSAVDALANLPTPVLAILGGATALATGLAAAGGAGLAFSAALSGIVPLLSKVIPALTGIQVAATGAAAGVEAVAVAFNPFAAALAALAIVGGGAIIAISSMEQISKAAGDAISQQSREVAESTAGFLKMRDAISKAAGASADFVIKGESVATTLGKVRDALDKASGGDFLSALEKSGGSFEDLGKAAQEADKKVSDLEKKRKVLADFVKAGSETPGVLKFDSKDDATRIVAAVEKEFKKTGVTIEEARQRLLEVNLTLKQTKQTSQGLIAPAIEKATPAFVLLTSAAENAQKVVSDFKINGDTDSLERNNKLLAEASKRVTTIKSQIAQGAGGKVDVGNITSIQDRLTSGDGSKVEKDALEGLIKAIDIRNKLEKQGSDIATKGVKARVDAALEDARSLETHKERIAALREVQQIEGQTAEQKKAINAEIDRETKAQNQEIKQASKEHVQQLVFEAQQTEGTSQQKIAALQRVLDQVHLEASQRRAIIKEIGSLEDQLAKEREARHKAEADALASESQRQQELIIAAIDERISKLQQEADAGKNVQAELLAAIQERTDKEVALTEEKTAARAAEAKSSKVADEIEKTGALEVEAARRVGTDAINEQKKAQDERIKKIREERKEALKAAKDEKDARKDVGSTDPFSSSSSSSSSQSSAPSSQGQQQQQQGPGLSLEQVAQQLASVFSAEAGRVAADDVKARRQAKDEASKASFETANPELLARVADEDAKRKEALDKADAARQKEIADRAEAHQKEIAAKQAAAVAAVRGGTVPGSNDLAGIAAPTFKPVSVSDTFQKTVDASKKADEAKAKAAAVAPAQAKPTSGSVEITLKFDQPVKDAKITKKSADLDGKIGNLQREASKISFRVNT